MSSKTRNFPGSNELMHTALRRNPVGAAREWSPARRCTGCAVMCGAGLLGGLSLAFACSAEAQSPTFSQALITTYLHACKTFAGDTSPDCHGLPPQSAGQVEVENENLSQPTIEQRRRDLQCLHDSKSAACGSPGGASADSTSLQSLRLFVSGSYENKDKENTGFETGFNSDKAGVTVGTDTLLGSRGVIGGAVTYGHTWGDFQGDNGDFNLDSIGAILYGSYYPSDQSFVDAAVGVAYDSYSISRGFTRFGGGVPLISPAKGDTAGFEITGSLSGGYDFTLGALTIGPRVGLNYKRTEYGAFTEHGSVMALHYEDQVEDSLTTTLGAQASYAISTDFGVVVPQVSASYVHEFLDDQHTVHAHSVLVAGSNGDVDYLTGKPDRDYGDIGAGISIVLPNGIAPFVSYQAEVGNSVEMTQTATVGLRLEF